MLQVKLALSPELGLPCRISLSLAPSLQTLRPTRSPSLFVRILLRYYGLVRLPAVLHHGCTFIFDHADHANWAWPTTGSPGFRARSATSLNATRSHESRRRSFVSDSWTFQPFALLYKSDLNAWETPNWAKRRHAVCLNSAALRNSSNG